MITLSGSTDLELNQVGYDNFTLRLKTTFIRRMDGYLRAQVIRPASKIWHVTCLVPRCNDNTTDAAALDAIQLWLQDNSAQSITYINGTTTIPSVRLLNEPEMIFADRGQYTFTLDLEELP